MYPAPCGELFETSIGLFAVSFKNSVLNKADGIVSCFYSCLKKEFVKRALILYHYYPAGTIEFLSDAAFTDAVLLFTERAKTGRLYNGNANVKTVLSNFFMMKLRQNLQTENRLSQKNVQYAAALQSSSTPEAGEDLISVEERYHAIELALGKMEPGDRQIIIWRHLEVKTCDEIAQLLGINTASATNRIYRCMQRLRNLTENIK